MRLHRRKEKKRHRKVEMSYDSLTTREANTKPSNMLPTSPIKTFALGRLNGRKPRQEAKMQSDKIIILSSSNIDAKKAIKANPARPVIPAIPLITVHEVIKISCAYYINSAGY